MKYTTNHNTNHQWLHALNYGYKPTSSEHHGKSTFQLFLVNCCFEFFHSLIISDISQRLLASSARCDLISHFHQKNVSIRIVLYSARKFTRIVTLLVRLYFICQSKLFLFHFCSKREPKSSYHVGCPAFFGFSVKCKSKLSIILRLLHNFNLLRLRL